MSCIVALAAMLTGCGSFSQHVYSGEVDGVLWRQVAVFKDALSTSLYRSTVVDPVGYLASLEGERWDGSPPSADSLDIGGGGVVLYDVSSTASTAAVSVFIASGPRPDVTTDEGRAYRGPSEIYTCYSIEAVFDGNTVSPQRDLFAECPESLVDLLSDDAAFVSGDAFDG